MGGLAFSDPRKNRQTPAARAGAPRIEPVEKSWFDTILDTLTPLPQMEQQAEAATGQPLELPLIGQPREFLRGFLPTDQDAILAQMQPLTAPLAVPLAVLGRKGVGKATAKAVAQEVAEVATPTRIANPIKAYHGSPHDFDAFDASKIGTGEGAQAYGHGLYFAEREDIAKAYRENLAGKPRDKRVTLDGEDVYASGGVYQTTDDQRLKNGLTELHGRAHFKKPGKESIAALRGDLQKTIDNYRYYHAKGETMSGDLRQDQWRLAEAEDALYALDTLGDRLDIAPPHQPGKTYEVNLHASPDELLDWDTPLSAQPQKVREALSKYGVEPTPPDLIKEAEDQLADYWKEYEAALRKGDKGRVDIFERSIRQAEFDIEKLKKASDMTGKDAYREIAKSDRVASQRLREAGVPGIRYLDQGSRGGRPSQPYDFRVLLPEKAGGPDRYQVTITDGPKSPVFTSETEARAWLRSHQPKETYNIVITDDTLIEIAKKYGIPLATVQAAYAAYQRDQQQVPLSALGK